MLLFSFHTHASCTLYFTHLCAVHGYDLLFFSSILPSSCCCIMFHFHSMAMLDACPLTHAATYLGYVGTHQPDLIHICTYTTGSIKGSKCQPENSSLALLVFPLNQRDHLQNCLLVPTVCLPFNSLEYPVDAGTIWVVSVYVIQTNRDPLLSAGMVGGRQDSQWWWMLLPRSRWLPNGCWGHRQHYWMWVRR